jgi:L-fucose mutarotase/ribose pyranase (RbsD/FucU family)
MIRDSALAGSSHPRRQLPAGMLPLLLEAARRGESEFTIAICDQLAPTRASNATVLHHASIPACIRAVCYHCPPITSAPPVVTMAPDRADCGVHHPDVIGSQWRAVIDESWPTWTGVPLSPLDRNEFYDLLPKATVVVHTLSDEPYANVFLKVAPAHSASLLSIPREICPRLANELSLAGHSNAVAIVPSTMEHVLEGCSERALRLRYPHSTEKLASIISTLWLPDTHVQHPGKPLQTPLGILTSTRATESTACSPLSVEWQHPRRIQALTLGSWGQEVSDTRLVAAIVAEAPGDTCYLMKNSISGHDGGF